MPAAGRPELGLGWGRGWAQEQRKPLGSEAAGQADLTGFPPKAARVRLSRGRCMAGGLTAVPADPPDRTRTQRRPPRGQAGAPEPAGLFLRTQGRPFQECDLTQSTACRPYL